MSLLNFWRGIAKRPTQNWTTHPTQCLYWPPACRVGYKHAKAFQTASIFLRDWKLAVSSKGIEAKRFLYQNVIVAPPLWHVQQSVAKLQKSFNNEQKRKDFLSLTQTFFSTLWNKRDIRHEERYALRNVTLLRAPYGFSVSRKLGKLSRFFWLKIT